MDTSLQLRLRMVPSPSWLLLLILAAVLVSIVALAISAVPGPRVPPYGPARNGVLVHETSGDIVRVDPGTGTETKLVTGPANDYAPLFAPDASRFAFARDLDDGPYLMVAEASGENVRQVTGPLVEFDSLDWSGDSRSIAVIHGAGSARALTVHDVVDGTEHRLDLGGLMPSSVHWLPPSGEEILFRGQGNYQNGTAIFAIRPDGSGLRPLTPGGQNDIAYSGPVVSPDGQRVAYIQWEEQSILRTHVRDLGSGQDFALPDLSPTTHLGVMQWSPDGTLLLVNVNVLEGAPPTTDGTGQLYLFASDGSTPGRQIGPSFALDLTGNGSLISAGFSPDGTLVYMVHASDRKLWALPVTGGPATVTPYESDWPPTVERLAR